MTTSEMISALKDVKTYAEENGSIPCPLMLSIGNVVEGLKNFIPVKVNDENGFAICPKCKKPLNRNSDKYCRHCGIEIEWINFAKEQLK